MFRNFLLALVLGLLAAGCEDEPGSAASANADGQAATAPVPRWYEPALLRQGRPLYNAHCSDCHGAFAQGEAGWQRPGADGKLPPPPLNGSGHAWHHSLAVLHGIIRDGGQPGGNMPAWGGTLNDRQILAVIAYLQSLWPERVYRAWADNHPLPAQR